MSEPMTVTYSLEEVLKRIEDKLDKIDEKFEAKFEKFETKLDKLDEKFEAKFDKLDERLNTIEVGQGKLEEKVDGLGKRLDNQEFINRGVLVGLIIALLGGLAKMFGFIGTP
ncbi:MAG: coiled-coil domain-containing protein [Microcystaceae cyanobacterium]